ncbi:MAG: hypothetical protein V3V12_08015 [Gammaproteobacteria bacterium]
MLTARSYDPASGRLSQISTGTQGHIQSLRYTFDPLGNLKERIDTNQNNLKERFGYDKLNRLIRAELVGFATKEYPYDAGYGANWGTA